MIEQKHLRFIEFLHELIDFMSRFWVSCEILVQLSISRLSLFQITSWLKWKIGWELIFSVSTIRIHHWILSVPLANSIIILWNRVLMSWLRYFHFLVRILLKSLNIMFSWSFTSDFSQIYCFLCNFFHWDGFNYSTFIALNISSQKSYKVFFRVWKLEIVLNGFLINSSLSTTIGSDRSIQILSLTFHAYISQATFLFCAHRFVLLSNDIWWSELWETPISTISFTKILILISP